MLHNIPKHLLHLSLSLCVCVCVFMYSFISLHLSFRFLFMFAAALLSSEDSRNKLKGFFEKMLRGKKSESNVFLAFPPFERLVDALKETNE